MQKKKKKPKKQLDKCKYERNPLTSGYKITLDGFTYRKNQFVNNQSWAYAITQ